MYHEVYGGKVHGASIKNRDDWCWSEGGVPDYSEQVKDHAEIEKAKAVTSAAAALVAASILPEQVHKSRVCNSEN